MDRRRVVRGLERVGPVEERVRGRVVDLQRDGAGNRARVLNVQQRLDAGLAAAGADRRHVAAGRLGDVDGLGEAAGRRERLQVARVVVLALELREAQRVALGGGGLGEREAVARREDRGVCVLVVLGAARGPDVVVRRALRLLGGELDELGALEARQAQQLADQRHVRRDVRRERVGRRRADRGRRRVVLVGVVVQDRLELGLDDRRRDGDRDDGFEVAQVNVFGAELVGGVGDDGVDGLARRRELRADLVVAQPFAVERRAGRGALDEVVVELGGLHRAVLEPELELDELVAGDARAARPARVLESLDVNFHLRAALLCVEDLRDDAAEARGRGRDC
mmetsp:Transcript_35317/g.108409  ORF Transcript_35317/g.108409 Transcript_35317/m.108409 type:complete len:338 (-) Transcript_35317:113-1126(-)